MASLMENLIDVLGRESTEYEALLQLSQRKTPIIAGGDLAELQKITDEEQELVRSWSDRARGHFSRVETAVVDVKTNLLYQLEGTESIVSVDYVFEGEESEFLTEAEEAAKRNMEQTLFRVLSDLRAVMAFRGEKRGFYCLDASGMEKLILDGNGNSEMERFLPYKAVGYVPGNEIETEQLNRREKNRREFEARGVYVPVFYPLLETEAEGCV